MRSIRTVFFDVGGTLAHPRPSFNGLLAEVCRAEGLPVTVEAATRSEPAVWAKIAERLDGGRGFTLSHQRSREFWLWVYREFLDELGFPGHAQLPGQLYAAFARPENYQLFDDALPALGRLRNAGLSLGVISNWEPWADRLLDSLGIRSSFQCALISGVFGVEKPDPRIFLQALEATGAQSSEALHVGDNPTDDVHGALAVGMHAVLLERAAGRLAKPEAQAPVSPQGKGPGNGAPLPVSRSAPLIPPPAGSTPRPNPPPLRGRGYTITSLRELPALLGIE